MGKQRMKQVHAFIDSDLYDKLRAYLSSMKLERQFSAFVREAIKLKLERELMLDEILKQKQGQTTQVKQEQSQTEQTQEITQEVKT
jgi:hypothetical protein